MAKDFCACGRSKDQRASVCRVCFCTNPAEKLCRGCEMVRPASDFSLRRNDTVLRSRCRECEASSSRLKRQSNPAKAQAVKARWAKSNTPGAIRFKVRTRARRLGLDPDMVFAHFQAHRGLCDICESPATLAIDHDHASGVFRGFLCVSCNNGLGRFKDDPSLLRAAADYLARPRPSI